MEDERGVGSFGGEVGTMVGKVEGLSVVVESELCKADLKWRGDVHGLNWENEY